jgi:hypothetical protein
MDNMSWSDKYRVVAEDWCDKESAAQLLEDMKSAVMAQRQTELGDIPVNRAEQSVKASKFWEEYVHSCVKARKEANLAKVKVEEVRIGFSEWNARDANERAEFKMTMGGG